MKMKYYKEFCIFIITHGRAENQITYRTLQRLNCKYKIYFVIDDIDDQKELYKNIYKEKVIIFNKQKEADKVDQGDNLNDLRTTTHARNACYNIANEKGYDFFLVLDDDYSGFYYIEDKNGNYIAVMIKDINNVINCFIEFLKRTKKIKTVCFLQGGDLFGGKENGNIKNNKYPFKKRKAMNSFFCVTNRKIKFISRLNEDVNTYLTNGSTGDVMVSVPLIKLNQKQTQQNAGGMTETYNDNGTYIKSFFFSNVLSIMC